MLFEGFELLDACGPLELLGGLPDLFSISLLADTIGPIASAQGPALVADTPFDGAPTPDVVLVPGGIGTRGLVDDAAFLHWLGQWAAPAEIVTSVCTGAGLLAAAGLLDGYRATTNKRAFAWPKSHGPHVEWVTVARWVHDRDRWTSSGVAAGMDMTLALIAHLHGEPQAAALADRIELEWHRSDDWDPFAGLYDLDDPAES